MPEQVTSEIIKKVIYDLWEETFREVQGYYLDGGTSLYPTLAKLSSKEASVAVTESSTSIAAQTEHLRYYLQEISNYIRKIDRGKIDWRQSWRKNEVTAEEWTTLKENLIREERMLLEILKNADNWSSENTVSGALDALMHTAYHLGSIRQILHAAKNAG